MKDQNKLWDEYHTAGNIKKHSEKPTDFLLEVLEFIQPNSHILDLGCGVGNDSVGFAKEGHNIIGTDFSSVVIQDNSKEYKDISNLSFRVVDLSIPLEFKENSFDLVYARLSLHYFSDEVTRNIFNEIHRVLKPGGYICFMCKSVDDSIYGEGTEIEKDMFERKGHVRHFFSEEYVKSCLDNKFEIEIMKSEQKKLYDRQSGYVKVIAKSLK
jgi:ubiquinone/menaquinone biosynthesis C-methylase UbiE